jgi:hypothetical protein
MPLSAGRTALRLLCVFAISVAVIGSAGAQPPVAKPKAPPPKPAPAVEQSAIDVDQTVQSLKDEMVQFNRDASAAEDEFLYPPESGLSVYVSNAIPDLQLRQVTVQVDETAPVTVTYDEDAAHALIAKDALQRVLRANIARGGHRIKASFSGQVGDKKDGDPVTGTYDALFDKGLDPVELELEIGKGKRRGATIAMQIKEWRSAE